MSNIVDGNKSNLGQIGHVKDGSFQIKSEPKFKFRFFQTDFDVISSRYI